MGGVRKISTFVQGFRDRERQPCATQLTEVLDFI